MTDENDMDDVPEHLIPEEQVEAILSGEDLGPDLSELLTPVAAVFQRAQQPPSSLEQLEANAAISTIVEARRAASDELAPRRTRMLPSFSKRTAAIVVGVTLWSTVSVAAAATGNLPFISGSGGDPTLQELADETTTTDASTTTTDATTTTAESTTTTEATTTTQASTTTTEATTTTAGSTSTTSGATTTTATSTTGSTVAAAASTLAARGVGPDPNGPAKGGLCNAYMNGLARGKPKNPNAPPWRNLIEAAGGADSVGEFCGVSTSTSAAPATTAATTTAATTTTATTVAVTAAAANTQTHGNGNGNGNGNGHGNGH